MWGARSKAQTKQVRSRDSEPKAKVETIRELEETQKTLIINWLRRGSRRTTEEEEQALLLRGLGKRTVESRFDFGKGARCDCVDKFACKYAFLDFV